MLIDFQPVLTRQQTFGELASRYRGADLAAALNSYVDHTLQIVQDLSAGQLAYAPPDPRADDPHAATEAERHAGWSLSHILVHITASAEEAATFSSILARGVPIGGRLRHEHDWRLVTSLAQAIARLEESRRMCLAYLGAWPDPPDLDTTRIMPAHLSWMKPNAPIQFLAGLMHWDSHVAQLRHIAEQARRLKLVTEV